MYWFGDLNLRSRPSISDYPSPASYSHASIFVHKRFVFPFDVKLTY